MIADCIEMEYEAAELKVEDDAKSPDLIFLMLKVFLLTIVEFFKNVVSFFLPPKTQSIKGQLALVTGGGNGLGKALCRRLAKEKCDIAVVDIDLKSAEKTASEIEEEFKVQCRAFKCDVSNISQVQKLKEDVETAMRVVDVLVNNAGMLYVANFATSSLKDIKKVVNVNLSSQLMLTKSFILPMMDRGYGKVVSVSSVAAINSFPFGTTYTATKYGIDGFMNALYDELCALDLEEKIQLTTIYPDMTRTRKDFAEVIDRSNLRYKMMTPDEVADDAVDAILQGKRRKIISYFGFGHVLSNKLPDRVRKFVKNSLGNLKALIQK